MNTTVFVMETEIQFVTVPPELAALVGEADPGTRIYRQEGTHDEMVVWFDALCEHIGGSVSPGGAAVYAGVTRAGVHKRLRVGKLTAFCFHITKEKKTLFGGKKTLKDGPIIFIPTSECQDWRKELEGRVARIEATKSATAEDEAAFEETDGDEKDERGEFLDNDPKDKRRKHFRRAFPWEDI